ncbi:TetR/AcrR family transcriptional regulator [Microlunatus spumicola]|uniref:TetR/AcrR family transcriptional regulator n=1 Tax=Microlunatus spumicola TaxID=81499 RepID=A0ABP6Y4Q8_9ACTN
MSTEQRRPTRREERRVQTVREIKALAMEQIRSGGPDAVSLSGVVREMAMSPAAVYRYFENRDALLADLVVDAYDDFADFLESRGAAGGGADETLAAVLGAARTWAGEHPNEYRLVFQSRAGSGVDLAPERTVPAATRSMLVLVRALAAADGSPAETSGAPGTPGRADGDTLDGAVRAWAEHAGLDAYAPRVLRLALASWTRLHGVISLELGGHLGAAGLDPAVLYAAEVDAIVRALVEPGTTDLG